MTEENQDVVENDNANAPQDDQQPDQEQEQVDTGKAEEKARRMGWRPKEEFKGDDSNWVDADEFLRRGEETVPLLKANLDKAERRLQNMEKTMQQFAEHHKKVAETEYNKALEKLRKERAQALSEFDGDRLNQVEQQMEELKNKGPETPAVASPTPEQQAFQAWEAENEWVKDPEGAAIATAIAERIKKDPKTANLAGQQLLDTITTEAQKKYPQLFPGMQNPNRDRPASVGSGKPSGRQKQKTFNDLPRDAQEACRNFVKRGLMKEEQYVKEFFGYTEQGNNE